MIRMTGILKWICFGAMLILFVSTLVRGTPSRASFEHVRSAVTASADMTGLTEGGNQMLRRLYGLAPEEFRGSALYYPASNMAAEELLVLQLKDQAQEEAVLEAVRKRLQSQKDNFEGYGVEQTEMLAHSVIEAKGNYVLFVSMQDPAPVRAAFLKALQGE